MIMDTLSRVRQRVRQPVLLGIIAATIAAMAYGSGNVIGRHVVTEHTVPLVASFFALVFGTLIIAPFIARDLPKDRHAPKRGFILMALAGVAGSGGVTSNLFALSHAPVVIVAPVGAITPLISLALAHLFLQRMERVTPRIWIGAALVVAGVILITLSNA